MRQYCNNRKYLQWNTRIFPFFYTISTKGLGQHLLIVIPSWHTVRNVRFIVPFANELFTNKDPRMGQQLAAQIRSKFESLCTYHFPNRSSHPYYFSTISTNCQRSENNLCHLVEMKCHYYRYWLYDGNICTKRQNYYLYIRNIDFKMRNITFQ